MYSRYKNQHTPHGLRGPDQVKVVRKNNYVGASKVKILTYFDINMV